MLRRILPRQLLPLLTALFVLCWGAVAYAQTTGEIAGVVTDKADDSELPGVSVILSSPDGLIGGAQTVVSDDSGRFRFNNLLPGRYALAATRDNFKAVELTNIQVVVGQTANASFAMESGNGATMVVEGKAKTVDVENVTRGEVLTKEFLQMIPTGRSYQSAVTQVAGVVDNGSGNPNMGGGASNENTYMLDGINITDPVTGTFSANFNYDAIQQIQVLLGGYEPEYGISLGGIINLVTESGNNNLQFDTSVYYQNRVGAPRIDARYAADGFRIAPTGFDSQFSIAQINAKVSGPIVRDRAWFLFSYSGERSLIANAGVAVPRDYDGNYILGKLTVQPSSEHRFSGLIQMNPTSIDNGIQNSIYVRPEAQQRQYQGGFLGQVKWQWFLSPNTTLDTQAVYQKSFIEVNGVPCTHNTAAGYNPCQSDEQEGDVDWETPGRTGIGGAFDSVNYGYFYFDDRTRVQASSKLSVLSVEDPLKLGTHDFKFGVEASQQVWDQLQGYAGNTLYYDINQISYDPQSFSNYYWLEITGPIKFRTTGQQFNVFAQDAWKPVNNLTIKYGLRYDNTVYRNDVGNAVLDAGLLGPRLYAAWDPFGDQKTKIAGGYGRFNDTARFGVASFTSTSDYGSKLYFGELLAGSNGQGFLNASGNMFDIAPRSTPNTSLDGLRVPRQDELVLLLQRQLIEDVSLGSNLSLKMTRNLFEFDETNLIYDQDGSQVIGSRNADSFTPSSRLRTPNITKRDYIQADFYLDKINSRRWFGRATYSYVQSIGNSSTALSGSFANDPQTQYNYGNLIDTDIRHQVKAYGGWNLPTDPWKQVVAFSLVYNSGYMFERRYWNDYAQGYGIRIRDRGVWDRMPGWWNLSVHLSQDIDVKKGKLVLDLQVFNVFNNLSPQFVNTFFVNQQNRMLVSFRQDPFLVQGGVQYHF